MRNIEIVELRVTALPGAAIGTCLQDAIRLAADEWRNVRLSHDGKDYLVRPNELLLSVREG